MDKRGLWVQCSAVGGMEAYSQNVSRNCPDCDFLVCRLPVCLSCCSNSICRSKKHICLLRRKWKGMGASDGMRGYGELQIPDPRIWGWGWGTCISNSVHVIYRLSATTLVHGFQNCSFKNILITNWSSSKGCMTGMVRPRNQSPAPHSLYHQVADQRVEKAKMSLKPTGIICKFGKDKTFLVGESERFKNFPFPTIQLTNHQDYNCYSSAGNLHSGLQPVLCHDPKKQVSQILWTPLLILLHPRTLSSHSQHCSL